VKYEVKIWNCFKCHTPCLAPKGWRNPFCANSPRWPPN